MPWLEKPARRETLATVLGHLVETKSVSLPKAQALQEFQPKV